MTGPGVSEASEMQGASRGPAARGAAARYDVVIVGASIAGCTAATLLGRQGLRVALVEKSPDPASYKRICTHFIQSSAVSTLERLGVLQELERMGARRSRARLWTRWGWIMPAASPRVPASVNIRRERLDPFLRSLAGQTPGVELILGVSAQELVRERDGTVAGIVAHTRGGDRITLSAPLTVGADGRDSRIGEISQVNTRRLPCGRFAYGAYYEGPPPAGSPDGSLWVLDPQMVGAFPTDEDLTLYACMPTHDRLPEFKRDLTRALESFISEIPDAPPILDSRRVGPVQGRIDMTNVLRSPTAPGLSFVGDAALALDPMWGIGCGFALQTAEWLADALTPALKGQRPLADGLQVYRGRYAEGLHEHAMAIVGYATGRRLNAGERLVFSAAARGDERMRELTEAFGTRNARPRSFLARAVPRALISQAEQLLRPRAGTLRASGQASEATL
jgi:flavin-dependent dehydrogenase